MSEDIRFAEGDILPGERKFTEKLKSDDDSRCDENKLVVVGVSKFFKTIGIIPNFWGIIVAENRNGKIILIEVRKPELNENINKNWLAKKLWRSDIVDILKEMDLYKGKSNYYKHILFSILMDNTSLDDLRGNNIWLSQILTKI